MVLISEAEAAGEGKDRRESSVTAETPGQRRGGVVRRALLPGLQPLADPTLLPAARSGTGRCRTELFTRRLSSSETAAAPCPPPSAELTVWDKQLCPQEETRWLRATCRLPGCPRRLCTVKSSIHQANSKVPDRRPVFIVKSREAGQAQ